MVRPKGYDVEGYIHFVEKSIPLNKELTEIKNNNKQKHAPPKDMYEISFEELEKMNLNRVGNEITYTNNVINLDRYMLYYWKHIIGVDCIFVFLHLWEYCDQRDGVDICYPKMTELTKRVGLSKPTLIKKLNALEENNFIVRIHRLSKKNGNREVSPIFKLRRTIPLLSKEQYHKLNPYIQKKHDDYMEKYANKTHLEWFTRVGDETIDTLINNHGDKIITKKQREETKKVLQSIEAEEYIMNNLPPNLKKTLISSSEFQKLLIDSKQFSKPAAEFYFNEGMVAYDEETKTLHLISKDQSQKEFFEDVIIKKEYERLEKSLENRYPSIYSAKCFTREQYIIQILKGNLS